MGGRVSWNGVSSVRSYQSLTMSSPSGFMTGMSSRTISARIRRISCVSSAATR